MKAKQGLVAHVVIPGRSRLSQIVDEAEHSRCQECGCYLPTTKIASAKFCNAKCVQRAHAKRNLPNRDRCGCGNPKLATSQCCRACAKQWSLERNRLEAK